VSSVSEVCGGPETLSEKKEELNSTAAKTEDSGDLNASKKK
jgi:hypothetical protein